MTTDIKTTDKIENEEIIKTEQIGELYNLRKR